jgi:hypothetical protein
VVPRIELHFSDLQSFNHEGLLYQRTGGNQQEIPGKTRARISLQMFASHNSSDAISNKVTTLLNILWI